MLITGQDSCKNKLLRRISAQDFASLAAGSELVKLKQGDWLCQPGQPFDAVFFPETGIASVTSYDDPIKVEIGLIGREGFVGIPVLLDVEQNPSAIYVQQPGEFIRLPVEAFLACVEASRDLSRLLHRYVHAYIVQVSSTAVANGSFNVEERLARWLLMAHDRTDGHELALTHDFIAIMLGVRRPGVTVATHVLEGFRAIKATRGRIHILDREKLSDLAQGSYGLAEAEYERVIGVPR